MSFGPKCAAHEPIAEGLPPPECPCQRPSEPHHDGSLRDPADASKPASLEDEQIIPPGIKCVQSPRLRKKPLQDSAAMRLAVRR